MIAPLWAETILDSFESQCMGNGRLSLYTGSEFLRHLHEYEAGCDYSLVSPTCSTNGHLTDVISHCSACTSDVTLSSSLTSSHSALSPPRPRVDADSDTPRGERFNLLLLSQRDNWHNAHWPSLATGVVTFGGTHVGRHLDTG